LERETPGRAWGENVNEIVQDLEYYHEELAALDEGTSGYIKKREAWSIVQAYDDTNDTKNLGAKGGGEMNNDGQGVVVFVKESSGAEIRSQGRPTIPRGH
jgi:hypothetical protein